MENKARNSTKKKIRFSPAAIASTLWLILFIVILDKLSSWMLSDGAYEEDFINK